MIFRWILVISVLTWGYWEGGGYGLFYAFLGLGIILFVVQTIFDGGKAIANHMQMQRQHNYNITVQSDAIKGHPDIEGTARRHPDPTRPTEEDFAGLITYRLRGGAK